MGRIKVWAAVLLLAPCMGCVSPGPDGGIGAINFSQREGTSSISSPQQHKDVAPPPGFVDFCRRYADQCSDSKANAERVTLTEEALQTLRLMNLAINHSIRPEDDREHYGREEYWTIPVDAYGDCEDYVLTKRKALIALGMSASALRITVVFTQGFMRHAVLTVVTDKGNYVLDNLSEDIVTWEHAPYTWIKWQDPKSRTGWASLNQQQVRLTVASVTPTTHP